MMLLFLLSQWSWLLVDEPGDVGYSASLCLDAQNIPHISCLKATVDSVRYAKWLNGVWATTNVVHANTTVDGLTSIAIDSQGRPGIAYGYWIDGTNTDLKYAKWTGSGWQVQTVDTDGSAVWISLDLDSQDRPHIAYSDVANSIVEYAYWTGSSWQRRQIDILGIQPSLALDSQNNPHVSYYAYASARKDLVYAVWNGSSWQRQYIDTAGSVGMWSSIALDHQDRPHISYYDSSAAKRNLKYAFWNGTAWQIQEVDTLGDVGRYSSIALDSQDRPHIAYYDVTNRRLKYAYWNGSSWTTEIADPNTYAGYWMTDRSLRVGSDDCPRIAYYRGGDLYYAHRGCPPVDVDESGGDTPSSGQMLIIAGSSVRVDLPEKGRLAIYDPAGREIRSWELGAGRHELSINDMKRGIYSILLFSEGKTIAKKTWRF